MEKFDLSTQGNNFTLSKIEFKSVYEKRVAYAIIDSVSPHLKKQINKNKELQQQGKEVSYQVGMFDIDQITYLAKDLESNRQHYPLLRKAIDGLGRQIKIETEEDIITTRFIPKSKWNKRSETLLLNVDTELIQFLSDLTHGYTTLQIKTALSLGSMYSMKIYEIICKWRGKKKFYISLEDLRFYTNTLDIYPQPYDFKKNVLEIAKKELKENTDTDMVFNYKDVKDGRNIVGFDIYPIKTKNAFEEKIRKDNVSPRWELSKELIEALVVENILVKGKTLEIIKQWSSKVHDHNDKEMLYQINKFREAAERKQGLNQNYAAYIINCIKADIKQA